MGWYIQTDDRFDKAAYIVKHMGGHILPGPPNSFEDIPTGKALIVVFHNTMFEAAGFVINKKEFRRDTDPLEDRARDYVLMDWDRACKETGYHPDEEEGSINRI